MSAFQIVKDVGVSFGILCFYPEIWCNAIVIDKFYIRKNLWNSLLISHGDGSGFALEVTEWTENQK